MNVEIVSYYKLDGISGAVKDELNRNNGSNSGATRGVTGKINNSFSFDGSDLVNTTLSTSELAATNGSFSFSLWGNTSNTGTVDVIVGGNLAGTGVQLFKAAARNMRVEMDGSGLDSTGTFQDGNFHHFAVTYDGTTVRLYTDGIENISGALTHTPNTNTVILGAFSGATNFWIGNIDEVSFWNRTLSASEISDLFNNDTGITFTNEFPPTITINAPANNSNFSASNVTFNATITSSTTITNVSLFIDNIFNESNTSGVQGIYLFEKNLSDGTHTWNINVTNDIPLSTNSSIRTFTTDLNAPLIEITTPIGRQNFIRIGDNQTLIYNITDVSIDTCTLNYNGVNSTLNCSATSSSFLYVNTINNLTIFANDTFGATNSSFVTWDYNVTEINQSFDSPVFTTSAQTFRTNITINNNFTNTPTSLSVIYNGSTTTGGTVTSLNVNNFSLTQTIDIPDITNGTSNWLFTFSLNSTAFNTSTSTQNVIRLDLANCNANSFINFTFSNETLNEEDVNATFDSNWNYFLGSGTVRRTLSFTNATENPFYGFCLNAVNDTLSTQVNVSYTNSISQQRQFRPSLLSLSNVTLNQVLFLLPTSDGIFAQFRTQNTVGNTLVGVLGTITRILAGNPITSAIDVTDGAGNVLFFLDPDITYTATFSLSGFSDNVFSFTPISDLTTVVMGTVSAPGNGTNITLGTSFEITPINTTLQNGTNVTFQFNVSSLETITFMGFNISNGTTTLLLVNQTSNGSIIDK